MTDETFSVKVELFCCARGKTSGKNIKFLKFRDCEVYLEQESR